jgi:hypothetical protein
VPRGRQFLRFGRDQVAVGTNDKEALVLIGANGRLLAAPEGEASDLPDGPWQTREMRFVPPGKGGTQIWNPATGLAPSRLRCVDRDGMLVALGPVVLVIDASAGKTMGRPPHSR